MGYGPKTLVTFEELKSWRASVAAGETIAFVPTMGALHEGHMTLVRKGKITADHTVVSIFVNPAQFGPQEDFSKYPRTLEADLEKLAAENVEAVFVPNALEIYPPHFQTYLTNEVMAEHLCGAHRPGHFRGVLTVVLKLFHLVGPDWAIFGKKDYQQWRLIERMVKDLDVPVKIIGVDTLRETDGLAMSSRNRYLGEEQRAKASLLAKSLMLVKEKHGAGEKSAAALLQCFDESMAAGADLRVEYRQICAQDTLLPCTEVVEGPAVILAAVYLDQVRLIDNVELS